jgi:hypothetical protein
VSASRAEGAKIDWVPRLWVFGLEVLEDVSGVAQRGRFYERLASVPVTSFAAEFNAPFLFLSAGNFIGELFGSRPLVLGDIPPQFGPFAG